MTISKELLDKLACPKCHSAVEIVEEGRGLACRACRLVYDIRDDIPAMIVELARPMPLTSSESP